jgi:hypothetical protein
MKKCFNRQASKECLDNKSYKIKSWIIDPDPYWDEMYYYYPRYKSGFTNFYKKRIFMYQVRMYKTWKYNRITQWK